MKINQEQFKEKFKDILLSNGYCDIIESSNLVSPYFIDEFNLSAGHQFVLPVLHNNEKLEAENHAIIQWCIRRDDISRVGYTNRHLSSFEMAVFGRFGYIEDRLETQVYLLQIFLELMKSLSIEINNIYFSITNGAKIMNIDFPFDDISYKALKKIGINDDKIIKTIGRQNFVFSNGQNRTSGYNIEIFYKLKDDFIEIASSNIYEYVLDKENLIKKTNTGIGVGIGIERLLMIINNFSSIYDILGIEEAKYIQLLGGNVNFQLAKSKIIRIEELKKTVRLIDDLVFNKNTSINNKQMRAYEFFKAKLESEELYLQISKKENG